MEANLSNRGRLSFDGPVRGEEDQEVQANQRKGNDGPAAALHVLVFQGNEQHLRPLSRSSVCSESVANSLQRSGDIFIWKTGLRDRLRQLVSHAGGLHF